MPVPFTLTMVGEVPQGTLVLPLQPGAQIISHMVPQQIGLDAAGFPAGNGDTVEFWSNAAQSYNIKWTYTAALGWHDGSSYGDPTPGVGESFLYTRNSGNGVDWVREFSISEPTIPEPTAFAVWSLLGVVGIALRSWRQRVA